MPTPTYTPLANITLGSNATSVTFSSIAAGYRDYIIVATGTVTVEDGGPVFLLNGDTGQNYPTIYMTGTGTSTVSSGYPQRAYGTIVQQAYWRQTTPNQVVFSIMDASAIDKHKTILSRSDMAGSDDDRADGTDRNRRVE